MNISFVALIIGIIAAIAVYWYLQVKFIGVCWVLRIDNECDSHVLYQRRVDIVFDEKTTVVVEYKDNGWQYCVNNEESKEICVKEWVKIGEKNKIQIDKKSVLFCKPSTESWIGALTVLILAFSVFLTMFFFSEKYVG